MQAFYVNALLRSLGFALVGIFTPVFVYQTMLSVWGRMSSAIMAVAGFYLLVRSVVLLINIPVAKLIEKIGFRRSVLVSVLLLIAYVGMMVAAAGEWRYLIPAAMLLGANIPLYWVSRGSVVAIDSGKGDLGKQVGLMAGLEKIAAVAGPVAAGLMIEKWGFTAMYIASGGVFLVSVIPLFRMPGHVHRNGVSLRGYREWLRDGRFAHQAVATVGKAMDDYGLNIVWPLAIMLMGVHYGLLGGVWSLLTLLAIVVRYGSGYLFDKLYRKRGLEDETLFGVAAVGTSLAWIWRLFVGSVRGVLLVDGGTMLFGTTWRNISRDYDLLAGKRMHEIAYFTYKEMTYSVAVIGMCVLWGMGAYLGIWKELVFGLAALWSLLSIVQARESNLK